MSDLSYIQFDSAGHMRAPNVVNITTATTFRIRTEKLTWLSATGYWFSQAGLTVNEIGIARVSGTLRLTVGNTNTTIASGSVSSDQLPADFWIDLTTGDYRLLYNDTLYTGTATLGTSRTDDRQFRLGARCSSDALSNDGAFFAPSGTKMGTTKIWVDDVLEREYIINKNAATTTITDMVNGQDGTLHAFSTGGKRSDFPPGNRVGVNQKYEHYDSMCVGVDTPDSTIIGAAALNLAADVTTISGDTAGLDINAAGELFVSDNTLLTTAGERLITFTRGADSVTLPVNVYDDSSNVAFYANDGSDANDGRQPHKPKQTLVEAYTFATLRANTFYKRGHSFDGSVAFESNSTYASWGDPMRANPLIVYDSTFGAAVSKTFNSAIQARRLGDDSKGKTTSGWTIKCLDVDGDSTATVPVFIESTSLYAFTNCRIRDNNADPNASGMRLSDCTDGGHVRFVTTQNIDGDGIYGTKLTTTTTNHEFGWLELRNPSGSVADSLQMTHENNPSQVCSDIWVHDLIAEHEDSGVSVKGAVVIEGTTNWLVENSTVEGKYFGIAAAGDHGTVRNVSVTKGGLPVSNPNYNETWGIGIGADDVVHSLSFYDNTIVGNVGTTANKITRGMIISGYGLSGDDMERYDVESTYNTIINCVRSGKAAGATEWSGRFGPFIADSNGNDNFENVGATASQGTYVSQTVTDPTVGWFASATTVVITGTVEDYGMVAADVTLGAGESVVSYQWRLRGLAAAGATSSTYMIPGATSQQINTRMPRRDGLNAATISCVVTVTDGVAFAYVTTDYVAVAENVLVDSSGGTTAEAQISNGTSVIIVTSNGGSTAEAQISSGTSVIIVTSSGGTTAEAQISNGVSSATASTLALPLYAQSVGTREPNPTIIYKNSTGRLRLSGLTDITGGTVTDATVTATLYDVADVEIAGQSWPSVMSHSADGNYFCTLSENLAVERGRRYYAEVIATTTTAQKTWRVTLTCAYA
jgi:hypothetical protein